MSGSNSKSASKDSKPSSSGAIEGSRSRVHKDSRRDKQHDPSISILDSISNFNWETPLFDLERTTDPLCLDFERINATRKAYQEKGRSDEVKKRRLDREECEEEFPRRKTRPSTGEQMNSAASLEEKDDVLVTFCQGPKMSSIELNSTERSTANPVPIEAIMPTPEEEQQLLFGEDNDSQEKFSTRAVIMRLEDSELCVKQQLQDVREMVKRRFDRIEDKMDRSERETGAKLRDIFNMVQRDHGESSRPVDRRSRRFEKSPIRRSSGEAAMAQALAVPIECTFCSDTEHWSDQCFRHLSVKWRIDFVKSNGRCVVCLKNHSGICRPREGSITKCHHCGVEMDHNSALCTSAAHYEKLGQLTEANSHK